MPFFYRGLPTGVHPYPAAALYTSWLSVVVAVLSSSSPIGRQEKRQQFVGGTPSYRLYVHLLHYVEARQQAPIPEAVRKLALRSGSHPPVVHVFDSLGRFFFSPVVVSEREGAPLLCFS